MTRTLDFALVDDLRAAGAFLSLAKDLGAPLERLPETKARVEAAIRFCWFISAENSSLGVNDDDDALRMREAFMRAALGEYVSMEDVALEEMRASGYPRAPRKIHESRNPLLHIAKGLRNFNFHLSSTSLAPGSRPAVWTVRGEDHPFDYALWTISNLTVEAFARLKNASHYSPNDLERMVHWFMDAQHEWGAHHLIFLAIEGYARELVRDFSSTG